ncbi:MAG: hypothetical protein ACE5NN_02160 [Candidatus Bathyarchaeia archaeon]
MESAEMSGFIVLFVGVAVLLFTFYNAYQFLLVTGVPATEDGLMETFGVVLTPLIETCIKAIYIGIMGWIGSILTRRGVQMITTGKEKTKPKKTEEVKEPKEAKVIKETEKAKETRGAGKRER